MIEYPAITSDHVAPNARLYADRYNMMKWINKDVVAGGLAIAEVGVAFGDFSEFLRDTFTPDLFVAIDTFVVHTLTECMGTPVADRMHGMTHEDYYRQRIDTHAHGRVGIVKAVSHVGLARYPDHFFDLIYLDAGHLYEDVMADVAVAAQKLNSPGILVFNDYTCFDQRDGVAAGPYGVIPAVNQLLGTGEWQVVGFALEKFMFCDIALRKI